MLNSGPLLCLDNNHTTLIDFLLVGQRKLIYKEGRHLPQGWDISGIERNHAERVAYIHSTVVRAGRCSQKFRHRGLVTSHSE